VSPGDGDIDWIAVHAALEEIGYQGTATLELNSGDADYLKDMRRRFALILSGEMRSKT
jgi:hexulose-6-phosphate isomerase